MLPGIPRTNGYSKVPTPPMTASTKAERTAGLTMGKVTSRNVARMLFPAILEASSRVESMDFIAGRMTR